MEAADAGFDVLIGCAFNYDAHAAEFAKHGRADSQSAHGGESFFVRHAYFLGAQSSDSYKSLKTTLRAEIDADAWASLYSDTSRPFERPKSGRIAVKVINHLGDEVMKVFRL